MELVVASHGLVVVAVWVAAWAKVCGAVWHSGLTCALTKTKSGKNVNRKIKKKKNQENNILIDREIENELLNTKSGG